MKDLQKTHAKIIFATEEIFLASLKAFLRSECIWSIVLGGQKAYSLIDESLRLAPITRVFAETVWELEVNDSPEVQLIITMLDINKGGLSEMETKQFPDLSPAMIWFKTKKPDTQTIFIEPEGEIHKGLWVPLEFASKF